MNENARSPMTNAGLPGFARTHQRETSPTPARSQIETAEPTARGARLRNMSIPSERLAGVAYSRAYENVQNQNCSKTPDQYTTRHVSRNGRRAPQTSAAAPRPIPPPPPARPLP